jgi:transposase
MAEIKTIGLDIAKSIFQVHGIDAAGQIVVRRQLRRSHVLKFFCVTASLRRRDRGLRKVALLVAPVAGIRA